VLYATALRLQIAVVGGSVGSQAFRNELTSRLLTIKQQLDGYYTKADYEPFIGRADAIAKELREVADDLNQRARIEAFISFAITVIAALASAGVGALVRVALVGEVVAGVRTAQSLAMIAFLAEAGTFTAAHLAGERVFLGRPITLESAAIQLASNVAMFGAFRALGRVVEPLARGSALRAFVIPHLANLTAMTSLNAAMVRFQTGQWPQDLEAFFVETIGSYILIAGVQAGVNAAAKPLIEARVRTTVANLEALRSAHAALEGDLQRLQQRFIDLARAGALDEAQFEAIRREKLEINARTRELARQAHTLRLLND
jgi:hypothetical protein